MSETLNLNWLTRTFPGAEQVLEYLVEHGTNGRMVRPESIQNHITKAYTEYENDTLYYKLLNNLKNLELIQIKESWNGPIYGVWQTAKGTEVRWNLAQQASVNIDSSVKDSFNHNTGPTAMGNISMDGSINAGGNITQGLLNQIKNEEINKEITDFLEEHKSSLPIDVIGDLIKAKEEESIPTKKSLLLKVKDLLGSTAKTTTFVAAITTIISHLA